MPRSARLCRRYVALLALVIAGCGDDKGATSDASSDTAASMSASASASTSTASSASAGSTSVGTSDGSGSSGGGSGSAGSTGGSTSAGSTSAASGSSTGGSSTGGCGDCGNPEYICCGECIDPRNDPTNCGDCGVECADPTPFCGGGKCQATPCEAVCNDAKSCCGGQCCEAGTICCEINGPVEAGPACVPPTESGTCPAGCSPLCQCAAPDTPIATPSGERPIAALRVGDLVYSVDGAQTVAVPIAEVQRTPVEDHRVVRVLLDDGAVMMISGSHPLADGRTFAALRAGDRLGERRVAEVGLVAYPHPATHDILPASSTGVYFVHGVEVGSTIRPPAIARASSR